MVTKTLYARQQKRHRCIEQSSAFSKTSLNIWKFTVHLLLKTGLGNCEHYFTRV